MNDKERLISLVVKEDMPTTRVKMALQMLQGEEKQIPDLDRYMDVRETCGYLSNISRVHLWALRKRGLPSHNIGGRLGFKKSELDKWIIKQ